MIVRKGVVFVQILRGLGYKNRNCAKKRNFNLAGIIWDIRSYISSSFSMPTFLTFGFQILSGIQAGAPLGLLTCSLSPVNKWTFFVPLSLSRISLWPRLAAFKAACLGDFPVKTPISLPFLSLSAKFLISAVVFPPTNSANKALQHRYINLIQKWFPEKHFFD